MTKNEKAVLDLILDEVRHIRELLAARATVGQLIEAEDDTTIVQMETVAPAEIDNVTPRVPEPEPEPAPEPADEYGDGMRQQLNGWLSQMATYLQGRGVDGYSAIKGALAAAGVESVSMIRSHAVADRVVQEVNGLASGTGGTNA